MLLAIMRLLSFGMGLTLVGITVFSALQTFVLPRSAPDPIVRLIFRGLRWLFNLGMRGATSYEQRDAILAFFAPVGLLLMVPAWLSLMSIGYAAMYWALGVNDWYQAYILSGSSLLTLGFERYDGLAINLLVFSEAALGLIMVALLIAYLPTIYGAFSRREALVTMLDVRAGTPPSAVELILRYNRLHGLDQLGTLWQTWEAWFADVEESHTSLTALVFLRSPIPQRSWVTAAGAVLDAASLVNAAVDTPHDMQADLTIRAGYLALRSITNFFTVNHINSPNPDESISVSREEFDTAWEVLRAQGVPLKPDRDLAWRNFTGWRVNYDLALLALVRITNAPPAPWSSDRGHLLPAPGRARSKNGRRS
jgi:hypothetical protein